MMSFSTYSEGRLHRVDSHPQLSKSLELNMWKESCFMDLQVLERPWSLDSWLKPWTQRIWELWMDWCSHRRSEFWIHRSFSTTLLRWPIWLTARLVSAHFVMTRSDRQYWHSTSARGYITSLPSSRMWNWGGVVGWWRLVEGWGRGCGSWRGVIVGRGGSRGMLVVCRWWSGGSLIHRGRCRRSLNYKIIFRNKFWVEKTAYW